VLVGKIEQPATDLNTLDSTSSALFVCPLTRTEKRLLGKKWAHNMQDFAAHELHSLCVFAKQNPATDLNTLGSCKQCFIYLFSGNCGFARSS